MTAVVAPPALTERLDAFEVAANGELLERSVEISVFTLALLSRSHVFMRAIPGVAKTFLARTMVALIGGLAEEDYFQTDLGRFSDPAEFLGPHDPRLLREGRFERDTTRMLPRARIAHLGEIGTASPATSNYLRSLMTERRFKNGRAMEHANLVTLICDANETLENVPDLRALWDRLTFRVLTQRVQGRGNREAMLRAAVARRAATGSATEPNVRPVISWSDIEQAQLLTRSVELPDEVYTALCDLYADLVTHGVYPSDRRLADATGVVQASAARSGRAVATPKDLAPLAHVLWTREEERHTVWTAVYGVASPHDAAALRLNDDVQDLAAHVADVVAAGDEPTRLREAVEAHKKLKMAANSLVALRAQAAAAGGRLELFAPLSAQILSLTRTLDAILGRR